MKTHIQRYTAIWVLLMMIFQIFPIGMVSASSDNELIYPLKDISKLDCRFDHFDTLDEDCIQSFPKLQTKDYTKFATQNGWYNDYTRTYTVLWGSSYKYGWDVGNWWHQGTDIATAKGTPVYSIADGLVIEAESSVSWGNYISIEHVVRWKTIVSNYAHLEKIQVTKGDKVSVGKQIGTVGSTWNSTGNHLHFQIDLPNVFHPYYYDYNKCPYSYYEITEKGVCFDELVANTYDPLAFLETNGAILDSMPSGGKVVVNKSSHSHEEWDDHSDHEHEEEEVHNEVSIFDTTVYYGFGTPDDVKKIQEIFRNLGYYKGQVNGEFADVEKAIIDYQIESWVLVNRTDDGAGWFGPKTRTQVKKDYDIFLENNSETQKEEDEKEVITQNTVDVEKTKEDKEEDIIEVPSIQKVPRENLLTREEIEAREVESFTQDFNIDLTSKISHLEAQATKSITIHITDRKGRPYRWTTPGRISFDYDREKLSIFPESFNSFNDGTREIKITGLASGNTEVAVKIGEKSVETFSITVGRPGEKAEVKTSKLLTPRRITLAGDNKWVIVMRDQYDNKLIWAKYSGSFQLASDSNTLYCLKTGETKNVKEIYKRDCRDDEYKETLEFDYDDTIAGVLLFDYRVLDQWETDLIVEKNSGAPLSKNTLAVFAPKWLESSYEYYDAVVQTLSSGIATGVKQGYFEEEDELLFRDASQWIENILKSNNAPSDTLKALQNETTSDNKVLTRSDFLALAHKYLSDEQQQSSWARDYRDTESAIEIMVANVLGSDYSWKDKFADKYFQPDKEITRWEAAYLLSQTLTVEKNNLLTRK